jgi:hypothetical protein
LRRERLAAVAADLIAPLKPDRAGALAAPIREVAAAAPAEAAMKLRPGDETAARRRGAPFIAPTPR